MRKLRRIISSTLAAALLAGSVVNPLTAFAGDTLPYLGDSARGKNQPFQHGYRAEDLLDWSPQTDPFADLLRAQVPLQQRNAAFKDTQADPNLDPEQAYFTLAGDYGNAFFDSYPYTNEFSQHLFNFWQYTDYYASWHGMPTQDVPESLYNAEGERNGTSTWEQRNFEFGMMNLPNPAYTNAAHKNGALSLGCIFQPRAYQHYDIMLTKDKNGNFPYAEKLIEICRYYGFDGWFFNMEGRSISSENKELLGQFFTQMRKAGLYIQWYTANGSFSSNTAGFLTTAKEGEQKAGDRAHSVFLDYGWTYSAQTSANTAAKFGLDPLKAVFGGVEAGRDRWGCDTRYFNKTLGSNGKPIFSIASLGTDFVQSGLDDDLGGGFRREQDAYQWMAFQRERLWWTGGNRSSGPNAGLSGEDIGASKTDFKGVSNFISERSVVNGDTFVTNFNTGHGLEYVQNGAVSNTHEWSNMNVQDILPTWQWWFDTTGSQLHAEFDYGAKYQKNLKDGAKAELGFTPVGAYQGGSSLAVYGKLDANNFMHLYKTDLQVNENSSMDVTFQKRSDDAATMFLGVIFKDKPQEIVKLEIPHSAAKSSGWVSSKVDLSPYKGKQIAAIGLDFTGTASQYQMNIGQLKYTSGAAQKPSTPQALRVDKAYETGEMALSWTLQDYSKVKQYNVYKVENGKEIYLGGTYDDSFYVKNIYGADKAVTIAVKAVSADGTESDAATVSHDYTKRVRDIQVQAEDGKLHVTWQGGKASVRVQTSCEATPRTWTASGENAADVAVPTGKDADGARYTMAITREGVSTFYEGRLDDSYSAPYDGSMKGHAFTNPMSKDWYKLSYTYTTESGQSGEGSYTRGTGAGVTNDHADFKALPATIARLTVTLEDYSHNLSKPVHYTFQNGEPIDLEKQIGKEEFPDAALLKAVQDKVGKTIGDLLNYQGALDISRTQTASLQGLAHIPGLTQLNISDTKVTDLSPLKDLTALQVLLAQNTQVASIAANVLPTSLQRMDFSRSSRLACIEENAIKALAKLESMDLSNCTALATLYLNDTSADLMQKLTLTGCNGLQALYLTGTKMPSFDITHMQKLQRLYANGTSLEQLQVAAKGSYAQLQVLDLSDSKFDLSTGTPERALADSVPAAQYNGQRPVAYRAALPKSLTVLQNGAELRMKDYFEKCYTQAKTVRGNQFVKLEGQSWIASDYAVAAQVAVPAKVYVEIRNAKGEIINQPQAPETPSVDTDTNVATRERVTILGGSGQVSSERYEMMFDDDDKSKWCTNGRSGWMGFSLDTAVCVGKWETLHAEVNNEPAAYNTEDFELQVLNAEAAGMDEEAFLKADNSTKAGILRDASKWTAIDHVTGNRSKSVSRNIDGAPQAGVYRLQVNKSINGNSNAAVRLHALKLYAADPTPRDYDGVFKLDKAGKYTVDFMKSQKPLGTMEVRVTADKESLNDLLTACEALQEGDYTPATWSAFAAKLAQAQDLAKQAFAEQKAVNDMLIALTKAKDSLVRKAEKGVLQALIAAAEKADLAQVTPASKGALETALQAAKALMKEENATQEQVNQAAQTLQEALTGLRPLADKSALLDLMAAAEQIDTSKYTQASVQAFTGALAAAKTVAQDANATPEQVSKAYKDLATAMTGLQLDVNRAELESVVRQAEEMVARIDDYRPSTVKHLQAALEAAKRVLAKANASQEELNQAAVALATEMANARVKAVKAVIVQTVEQAQTVDTRLYTQASVRSFRAALEQAKKLIADADASQAAVDTANQALVQAMKSLVPLHTDPEPTPGPDSSSDNPSGSSQPGGSSSQPGGAASKPDGSVKPGSSVSAMPTDNSKPGAAQAPAKGENESPATGDTGLLPLALVGAASAAVAVLLRKRRGQP